MTLETDASQLGYQDVRDYLRAHGWTQASSKRDYVAIYRHDAPRAEVLIPLDRDLADYGKAMWLAAREIATVERRTVESVLHDLRQPRLDRIRISLEGEDLENGTLALAQGVSLLSGVRKALLASASTVRHARRYHPRMSFSEAELFVQSCRLGQTEVGSYVLTVEAPHRLAANAATPDQAFGRQASAILMRAVQSIVVNVRKGDAQPLLEDPSPIVSANLCDALVDMMPADEKADLRFRATWSPLLPISEGVPNQVHVD
ncbi:MAG TPA: hypothetical protein VFQ61_06845, partial [Polyangiaceae bacterium]|nr:hypothetical protein [Polyangiaceae bacterium]